MRVYAVGAPIASGAQTERQAIVGDANTNGMSGYRGEGSYSVRTQKLVVQDAVFVRDRVNLRQVLPLPHPSED
jgi:hypothetical protein